VKDRRLLVRVPSVTAREFYLFEPWKGADFHIKFAPPRRGDVAGGAAADLPARVVRTTGTRELAAAKRIAADIVASFFRVGDGGASAELLKRRSDFARISELLEVYLARATQKAATARNNAGSLLLMVRTVHPGGDAGERSTLLLSKELIREFERIRFDARMAEERLRSAEIRESAGELAGRLAVATQQVRHSTASFVRQAKAVVGPEKMRFYAGLKLPDLSGFRGERVAKPRKSRPKPMDLSALTAMVAARGALRENDPGVYVVNLLMSCLGLRNIEVLMARRHWIMDGQMHIIDRPEENFFPKGAEGAVEVNGEVVREILSFQHLCVDGFLVPGQTMTDRRQAIYRRHSEWVKTWIRDHTKTSYELRRYAGSRLLDMGATIFDVRDFLRHRDVKTTTDWYAYRLGNRKLPTIGLGNLVPAAEVA
jgi:hypothetical protein